MILILGSTGYIGSAFKKELEARGKLFFTAPYLTAWDAIMNESVDIVINCAAFIPPQSVSECDNHQRETISGNLLFPASISALCFKRGITIAHISTGCLWNDGKSHSEGDEPQRDFNGHCGFYVGIKAMAEESVRFNPKHYIFRIRLPFDEFDSPRNYLSKLAQFSEVWDHENSLSHRGDLAKACLDLIDKKAEFGTYHITNPGTAHAKDIVYRMMEMRIRKKSAAIIQGESGSSIVSPKKLLDAGVKIRTVQEAINESLKNWSTK